MTRRSARRMRRSAGTTSPALSRTMSPGTRSAAGSSSTDPSRRTRAVGALASRSASNARSPRYSVMTSAATIGMRASSTSTPSRTSPRATARMPATMRRMTNGSVMASRTSRGRVRAGRRLQLVRAGLQPPSRRLTGRQAHGPIDAEGRGDLVPGARIRIGDRIENDGLAVAGRGSRWLWRHRSPSSPNGVRSVGAASSAGLHPRRSRRGPPRARLAGWPPDDVRRADPAVAVPVCLLSWRGGHAGLARQRADADRRPDPPR